MTRPAYRRFGASGTAICVALLMMIGGGCAGTQSDVQPKPAHNADQSVPQVKVATGVSATMLREEHDRLITLYAPVSEYTQVLTSAYVLYSDGTVPPKYLRAVIAEYDRRLRTARTRLRNVAGIRRSETVRVQLSRVVTLRRASLQVLRRDMRSGRTRLVQPQAGVGNQRVASARADSWRRQWSASIGAAREATNTAQEQRDNVSLEPMQEDAFR